jgi:hypothetical protein
MSNEYIIVFVLCSLFFILNEKSQPNQNSVLILVLDSLYNILNASFSNATFAIALLLAW